MQPVFPPLLVIFGNTYQTKIMKKYQQLEIFISYGIHFLLVSVDKHRTFVIATYLCEMRRYLHNFHFHYQQKKLTVRSFPNIDNYKNRNRNTYLKNKVAFSINEVAKSKQ
uniref:Uncharacterized protein n=1 Tax=Cacopsylla melanoneura TaxID=428564 RepID=A0A8D8TQZ7_9HEMI